MGGMESPATPKIIVGCEEQYSAGWLTHFDLGAQDQGTLSEVRIRTINDDAAVEGQPPVPDLVVDGVELRENDPVDQPRPRPVVVGECPS